jgi:hypothetical protein
MITELPHYLWQLPNLFQSADSRRSMWRKLGRIFKYRICMSFGDMQMERDFQVYFNALAICRIKMLMIFASCGCASTIILNYVLSSVDAFEATVRLGFVPFVALSGYIIFSLPQMLHHPRLTQLICVCACYGLFVGNLLLTMQTHAYLREAFRLIEPDIKDPSLIMPSNGRKLLDIDTTWLPKPPLNPSTFHEPQNETITKQPQQPSRFRIPFEPAPILEPTAKNGTFDYRSTLTYRTYLIYGIRYMSSLTGLVLYLSFLSSSAGLRFIAYLGLNLCIFLTIMTASIIQWSNDGVDGQSVRLVFLGTIIGGAGCFLVRVFEQEMRRWYAMKINYQL